MLMQVVVDLKLDLKRQNEQLKTGLSEANQTEKLYEIYQLHSDAKQLSLKIFRLSLNFWKF